MSVTPQFIGQVYKDTNTGNLWRANSLTPGDWSLELQNMQLRWSPTSSALNEWGRIGWDGVSGITALVINQDHVFGGAIDIALDTGLASVSAPNLLTIDNGTFSLSNLPSLTTVSFPNLTTASGIFITACTSLVSLAFPAFSIVGLDSVGITNCTSLTSVSLPLWSPNDGDIVDFTGCALADTSVNHILARCVANAAFVSGLIDLHGGTNSAPTGQGIIDKATLNGRLAGLAVTN